MLHYNNVRVSFSTLASILSVVSLFIWVTIYFSRALTLHRLLFLTTVWFLLLSPPSLIIATVLDRPSSKIALPSQTWFYMWHSDWNSFTFRLPPITIPLHSALLSNSLFPLFICPVFLLHVGACLPSALWISITAETVLFGLVNLCSKRACCPTYLPFFHFYHLVTFLSITWASDSGHQSRSAQPHAFNLLLLFLI